MSWPERGDTIRDEPGLSIKGLVMVEALVIVIFGLVILLVMW